MNASIVNYYGKQNSRCGYCKQIDTSIVHGMHAFTMVPTDYQDLIDRGWRRSGQYCYKPSNKESCCPCYSIKCDTKNFELSKSHKKILKRMNRFLRDGQRDELDRIGNRVDEESGATNGVSEAQSPPNKPLPSVNLAAVTAANSEHLRASESLPKDVAQKAPPGPASVASAEASVSVASKSASKQSADGTKPPCKKAKQMRLERRQAKLAAKGIEIDASARPQTQPRQKHRISDFLAASSPEDKHKLKIRLVHVMSREFSKAVDESYALYQKYQTRIHNDPPENLEEFLGFTQRSPLQSTPNQDIPAFGSYHQQYWLDEKLIAVGVIDILPHCVSSVYFFYDPDYSFLSLGTYGSLREIDYVQQLSATYASLRYYYMGFYIHSCPKMRYKGKLSASYLLCPEAYTWHLLTDEIRARLTAAKYQRFNPVLSQRDADEFKSEHLAQVPLLDIDTVVPYGRYRQVARGNNIRAMVMEYGRLVGTSCAHRLVFVVS